MSQITVIVATYNADFDKLSATLKSILLQKDVDLQIVVTDDGSKIKHDEKIEALFKDFGFTNYVITGLEENKGTVCNLHHGLQFANGDYVKGISPGDYLFNENTLSSWIGCMKETGAKISFCDAAYYSGSYPDVTVAETVNAPAHVSLFEFPQNRESIFTDYLLANDTILGAAVLAETRFYVSYIRQIVNRLVYAEDYALRLMIFDGVEIHHHNQISIWYECSLGISNQGNDKWKKLLFADFEESNRIIAERTEYHDALSKKYADFLKKDSSGGMLHKAKKCLSFPKLITLRADKKTGVTMTPAVTNIDFLKRIL